MEEINYNSNKMCYYLLKELLIVKSQQKALLEVFLGTVKALNQQADIEKLRDGLNLAARELVQQNVKSIPVYDQLVENQLLAEIESLLKGGQDS